MNEEWHPFVDKNLVEIESSARPKILHGLAIMQKYTKVEDSILAICYSKSGKKLGKDGAVTHEVRDHLFVGVFERKHVPVELIFDLMGFEVAYALNPAFGEEPRRVKVSTSDEYLVAAFGD